MTSRLRIALAVWLLGSLAGARVHAGGFEIYEESPAGTAMAGAMTAIPGDASAIFYNPAGIALQHGGAALLGTSLAFGMTTITTPDGTATDARLQVFTLPTVFVSSHIGRHFAAGLGVFTQFGNGVDLGNGVKDGKSVPFPGRFIATDSQLQTVTFNPTVAVAALPDRLSFGVGLDVVLAAAELKRQLLLGDVEASSHLGGTARAVGWNVGVQAVAIPHRLRFGFNYRSGYDLDFDMQAHFAPPPELASTLQDQPAKVTLPMPHNLSVGLAVHPSMTTTITADVHISLWHTFEKLEVTFPTMPNMQPLSAQQNWRDSVSGRLGFEWMAQHGFAVRLGFGYDQSPVPTSTLGPSAPVSDRWLATGGLAYTLTRTPARGLGIGAGYLAGISSSRTSSLPDLPGARYAQVVHVVSIALTYRWGGPGGCDCCGPSSCDCSHCGAVGH